VLSDDVLSDCNLAVLVRLDFFDFFNEIRQQPALHEGGRQLRRPQASRLFIAAESIGVPTQLNLLAIDIFKDVAPLGPCGIRKV
jgi:hypothetical protein